MSRSELYRAALADHLLAGRPQRVTAALDAIYGEEAPALDPSLLAAQIAALSDDAW